MKRAARLLLFSILILSIGVPPIRGQSAEFPYHGVLTAAGVPADGLFDLQFRLYDALEGGAQIGPTLWRENLVVRNGVFATRLDFGSAPFSGPERFLEVGVRLGQSTGGFSILTPRELLRPAPSALISQGFSGELAGDVAGPQAATRVVAINGVGVAAREPRDGQVLAYQSAVGRYEPTDLVASAGITIGWEVVESAVIQAAPNRGYLLMSDRPVTVRLPDNPAVGDIIRINGPAAGGWRLVSTQPFQVVAGVAGQWYAHSPLEYWTSIAASSDGKRLVAAGGGRLLISTDSGVTWTSRSELENLKQVVSSADGKRLAAIATNPFRSEWQIYVSGDSGVTWTVREESRYWSSMAISADGMRLAATVNGGQIYTSADAGQTWVPRAESRSWTGIASSANGQLLVAVGQWTPIHISRNGGLTWTQVENSRAWHSVSTSADGLRIIAAESPGNLYISTDGGTGWTPRGSTENWRGVQISSNGEVWAALSRHIHLSVNSGVTWQLDEASREWNAIALSENGALTFATVNHGYIYRNFDGTYYQELLKFTAPGAVTLIYLGNGRYARLSHP